MHLSKDWMHFFYYSVPVCKYGCALEEEEEEVEMKGGGEQGEGGGGGEREV